MSFSKTKRTEANGSGKQERRPRTFSTSKGSGTMVNGGSKAKGVKITLTLDTKLHEWNKSMEARVLDAKLTRWRTLWDVDPSEPKLKKRSQYLARLEEAEESSDEEENDSGGDEDSDREKTSRGKSVKVIKTPVKLTALRRGAMAAATTNARKISQKKKANKPNTEGDDDGSDNSSADEATEKRQRLKRLNRKIDDLLLQDSVTLDAERQTVYSMIWNSIDAEMQMRCEMHTMYQETRDNWHALDLLTMIEESHSKTALLGTEYARTEAYERFLNIKQDWNAPLVTYKADFEECIIQLKKYGDIPFTKKDIVLRFVRSLNGRHNAYAIKVTEDYHSSRPIPRDIDEVVTQLTVFEAARADVYKR